MGAFILFKTLYLYVHLRRQTLFYVTLIQSEESAEESYYSFSYIPSQRAPGPTGTTTQPQQHSHGTSCLHIHHHPPLLLLLLLLLLLYNKQPMNEENEDFRPMHEEYFDSFQVAFAGSDAKLAHCELCLFAARYICFCAQAFLR